MARIQQLPSELINQIAAGEVIERPASVVKEIVENAIDAGAKNIRIDIENAGSKLIRVRDDGAGIHPEDMALAFSTHATSKIKNFNDLEHVQTLGFRGEALPSIASISKTTLTSKSSESEQAYKIAPYLSMNISPAAHPQGTTIEIRDLFYNVPARKKFLKSERTERQHIVQLIERISLSHPEISITLAERGKDIAQYGSAETLERIANVLGEDFREQAVSIDASNEYMRLWGWIGLPTYSHSNADKQHLIVNGRCVRDKIIGHAVKQAYQDVLYHGRHPIFVLYLDIDPDLIDVNAHPQKHEIRYRENRLAHDFIHSALNRALRGIRPEIPTNKSSVPAASSAPAQPTQTPICFNSYANTPRTPNRNAVNESKGYYQWASPCSDNAPQPAPLSPITAANTAASPEDHPLGYAIGQIHNIFILAENAAGLVIVDMHAAHERILYEKMKAQLASRASSPSQKLLLALHIDMTPAQQDALEDNAEWLQRLGYQWRINKDSLMLDAVPALLKHADHSQIIAEVLDELEHYSASRKIERLQDQIVSTICCHSAVRAHHRLSLSEMNQLLRDIETTPSAAQCNHGRPTYTQLSEEELGALFMRGQ